MWSSYTTFFVLVLLKCYFIRGNVAENQGNCPMNDLSNNHTAMTEEKQLDPSYNKNYEGEVSTMKFKFDEILLYGIGTCNATQSVDDQAMIHTFNLNCSKLTYSSLYEVNGAIGAVILEKHTGLYVMTAEYVNITIISNYKEETIHNKTYVYFTHSKIHVHANGKVKILKDIFYTQKELGSKANDAFIGDRNIANKMVEQLTVPMMEEYTTALNNHLKNTPCKDS